MRWFPVLFIVQSVLLANVSCFNVDCEFSAKDWKQGASGNLCEGKNVVVQAPNQTITSINGQTEFQGRDVKMIVMYGQTLHYLPRGLEIFFPNIQGIQFYYSKVKSINKYDLKPFPNLKYIHIGFNALETVDEDLFEFTPNVIHVYLTGNNLTSVGANVFSKLEQLIYADFSSCGCINKIAQSRNAVIELMDELKQKCPTPEALKQKCCGKDLEKLHAEITELKSENKELKAQLKALRVKYKLIDGNLDSAAENLFLAKNKDESIEKIKELKSELNCKFDRDDKCDVVELKIKFHNTSIAKVKNEILATSQVTKMTIADQQTFFLPNNLADYFPHLTDLSITNSGLYGIDSSSFKGLKSLVTLVVKFNKVMQIPSDAFNDLESLRQLDMSFNKIRIISNGAFSSFQQLQQLRLNDNSLEMINNQIFEGLDSLESLSLQNNKLKFLSPNLFSQLAKLSSADFTNNVCIDMAHPNVTKEIITEAIVENCITSID